MARRARGSSLPMKVRESIRKPRRVCSSRFSPPRSAARDWACRSFARSSICTVERSKSKAKRGRERRFGLNCRLSLRQPDIEFGERLATSMCGKSLNISTCYFRWIEPLDQWLCHADARQVSDLPGHPPPFTGLRPAIAKFLPCQGSYDAECETHHLKRRSMSVHHGSRQRPPADLPDRSDQVNYVRSDRRGSDFMRFSFIRLLILTRSSGGGHRPLDL